MMPTLSLARSADKKAKAVAAGRDQVNASNKRMTPNLLDRRADKPKDVPLKSSVPPVNPPPVTDVTLDGKAVREYEYDRQRTKKVGDRIKAKEQKKNSAVKGSMMSLNLWKAKDSGDKEAWFGWFDQVTTPKSENKGFLATMNEKDDAVKPLDGNREVKLEELMQSAKVRKGAAGDFELVPKVRPVLVLDDLLDGQELDEPWEHISASDDEDIKVPSYAQVLSRDH